MFTFRDTRSARAHTHRTRPAPPERRASEFGAAARASTLPQPPPLARPRLARRGFSHCGARVVFVFVRQLFTTLDACARAVRGTLRHAATTRNHARASVFPTVRVFGRSFPPPSSRAVADTPVLATRHSAVVVVFVFARGPSSCAVASVSYEHTTASAATVVVTSRQTTRPLSSAQVCYCRLPPLFIIVVVITVIRCSP